MLQATSSTRSHLLGVVAKRVELEKSRVLESATRQKARKETMASSEGGGRKRPEHSAPKIGPSSHLGEQGPDLSRFQLEAEAEGEFAGP